MSHIMQHFSDIPSTNAFSKLTMMGSALCTQQEATTFARCRRIMRRHKQHVRPGVDRQLLSAIEEFIDEVESSPDNWIRGCLSSAGVEACPSSRQDVVWRLQQLQKRWTLDYIEETFSSPRSDSSTESATDLSSSADSVADMPSPRMERMQIDFLVSK
jgi:hypothetical protein